MKAVNTILFIILYLVQINSQSKDLNYYLPDIEYDENIPTPQQFLGYQVGDWHVSHDQLYMYMKTLAEKSDRIVLEEYGRSHENRPLIILKITSQSNQSRLEEIRQNHLKISDPGLNVSLNDQPIVIYQGYSIHGNEPSGSNASLLVAYYLAAGQGTEIQNLLDSAIIIFDPSYNPDGLHRFSTWANMHKSKNMTSDPASREYNEVWPRGRTNHYWFDLNRDWLLLTHPESRGRIRVFHEWKPNILTDHHEMGTNSTFFFQPGIPSRTNPNTPSKNQELTGKIGEFHASALDKIGSLYYSKESFDDFYYGKGSTYPDANGGIGILFEQASSRGHIQESDNGLLTFPFTIRNQVATSLSTQAAGVNLRKEILEYQRNFYKEAMNNAKANDVKAYVFGETEDPFRINRFIEILLSHQIEVYKLKSDKKAGNTNFDKNSSFIVPLAQPQYTLAKTLFEKVTSFKDSLFYDVSAWTMPLAFDLDYAELKGSSFSKSLLGEQIKRSQLSNKVKQTAKASYGYLIDWQDYQSPRALQELHAAGIRVKVMEEEFTHNIGGSVKAFKRGTLLVPIANQDKTEEEIYEQVKAFGDYGVDVYPISTGAPQSGIFMGSPRSSKAEKQEILLIIGTGINSYEAGATWHQLDQNFGIPITSGDITRLRNINLDRYSTIIMPDGNYNSLDETTVEKIGNWINEGGNLIAIRRAVSWAVNKKFANIKRISNGNGNGNKAPKIYGKASADRGANVIGGSIFNVKMDLTHPLCYGYDDDNLSVFRRDTRFYEPAQNAYATPLRYVQNPLQSGYMAKRHNSTISKSAAAIVCRKGGGTIICLMDNPVFRGYWWGSSKLLANAIFMSSLISNQTKQN